MNVTIEEFGGGSLSRAEKLLAGIPGGVEKALKAAMGRTVSHLQTKSGERIRERYAISQQNIRANENVRIKYSMGNGIVANVYFSGSKIPLYRFNGASPKGPQFQGDKLVHALVSGSWKTVHPGVAAAGHQLASTGPTRFENAFVATMNSGHTGIVEREGSGISEIMGSSVAQMIGHEEVAEKLAEDASKKFEERMDHEVARIISGWGK